MVDNIVLGATVKSTLTSIQRSREAVDRTSERLANRSRFFEAYQDHVPKALEN